MEYCKFEKSCGAVIYKIENNKIYFLLIKQKMGHYSFPKGHVENNETEEQTALREIKEETYLDVKLDNNFREVVSYSPSYMVLKDVVYFIATPLSRKLIPQLEEVASISWCTYDEALNLFTHTDNINILNKAVEYIKKNILK